MSAVRNYPVAAPRTHVGIRHPEEYAEPMWHKSKEKLVNQFRNFQSSVVEYEHLEMARELIEKHRGEKWYELVPLDEILVENGVSLSREPHVMYHVLLKESVYTKCTTTLTVLYVALPYYRNQG